MALAPHRFNKNHDGRRSTVTDAYQLEEFFGAEVEPDSLLEISEYLPVPEIEVEPMAYGLLVRRETRAMDKHASF